MNFVEITNAAEIGLIYGIIAIGVYVTFRVIDFPDLTCDGTFVLGAAISAVALKAGFPPWLALVIASFAGGFAGLITGFLNTRFKIQDILSGILVGFMLYSINLRIMSGSPNLSLLNQKSMFAGQADLAKIFVFAFFICVLFGYILITDFGLALRSIGQNKKLASHYGIRVIPMTMIGLIIGNGIIGFGGALFSQHQSFVDISQGVGTVIVSLAAIVIGEKLMPFRNPWVPILSCVIGSLIYRLMISIALHSQILGLETQDINLITGLMIIMIMAKRRLCSS